MSGILSVGGAGNVGASGSFYSYSIDQSLRFNDDDSPRLSLDPIGTPTLGTKCTISFWVKRAKLTASQYLFTGEQSNLYYDHLQFTGGGEDKILIVGQENASSYGYKTTAHFRDVGAWYHIVLECDSTQSTGTDRYKLYVNGVLQTLTSVYGVHPQNHAWYWNKSGNSQNIGRSEAYGTSFDGYMAEVNFIDGTALDATSFGETINGIWVPKAYSGSYGTNGFYLSFADSAAIGDDLSGNTNDFTANNLAASDVVPDSPTNNFATFNPLAKGSGTITFSEGNLKSSFSVSLAVAEHAATFTIPTSGKWYWEAYYTGAATNGTQATLMGIMDTGTQTVGLSGNHLTTTTGDYVTYYSHNNAIYINNVLTNYTSHITTQTSAIVGFALDMDNGHLWVSVNGTYINGTPNFSTGGNKVASPDITKTFLPFFSGNGGATFTWTANFGQEGTFAGTTTAGGNADDNGYGDFKYAVPSGFLALCSANLPEPAIGPNSTTTSDEHFTSNLWTGTGSDQTITTTFAPDFVWVKCRSTVRNHRLVDTVRGATLTLSSDLTDVELAEANHVKSFSSTGFTVGGGNGVGASGETHVGWSWKAGGTAVSNTDGSITSSVSANPDAGFSIVSYTGTGTSDDYGHGLGVAPNMIITKDRTNSTHWAVYVSNIGTGKYLELDRTIAVTTAAPIYPSVSSTTIGVGVQGGGSITNTSGDNYISYCFANVPGHLKCGSYVGNGSADGTFVYTGFRPAFVLCRRSSLSAGWHIFDNKRPNAYNVINKRLEADNTDAENSTSGCEIDFLSNGFKFRGTFDNINGSGATHIYLAFAEAPFKYANAR